MTYTYSGILDNSSPQIEQKLLQNIAKANI